MINNIMENIQKGGWILPVTIGLGLSVVRDLSNKSLLNDGEDPVNLVCEINVYLGILSLIFIICYNHFWKKTKFTLFKDNSWPKIGLGFIGLLGAMAVMYSVKLAANPAYPKAVYAMNVVLVLLLSNWFLGSELTTNSIIGMVGMVGSLAFLIYNLPKKK